jgi:aerotaxis receptor
MSVRTPARRDAIEAAERIYARLSEQERSAAPVLWRIVGGRAERVDLRGALSRGASRIADHRLTIAPLLLAGASWLLGQWGGPMHLGLALALAVALATAAQLRRAIERPLLRLLASAERIAAGDLTQHMECGRSDTVGRVERALHQMNVNLQSIIGDARREVEQMNHALAELAAGNQDMSVRTESQASSVQETAASMEELTTTVGSNTASARDAATLADDTAIVSGDGAQAVAGVRASMLSIDASSRRIADITQVIDTISFQTNILALNAAVEAARAGEQGRGFAVVASEVRALSNRTTEAAKQIKVLIEDSKTTVAGGVQQAQRASDLMDRGLVSVRKVSEFMRKIQQASDEQQLGISQACQAVAQLDGITQQNAAMVEELSACASALRGRAGILNSSMQVFRLANEVRPAPDAARLRRESRDASRARQPISA